MTEISYEQVLETMKDCRKRLDANDTSFDWGNIVLGDANDSLVDKIKNRLSNELYFSDNDVYRILLVLIEETKKMDEELF